MKDKSKYNYHSNTNKNAFPETKKQNFKFLGLVTDKETHYFLCNENQSCLNNTQNVQQT